MSGGTRIPFNEATRGHTIAFQKPWKNPKDGKTNGIKVFRVTCTCGWEVVRPRVSVNTGSERNPKFAQRAEPMVQFRARGDRHLYDTWVEAQQMRLA